MSMLVGEKMMVILLKVLHGPSLMMDCKQKKKKEKSLGSFFAVTIIKRSQKIESYESISNAPTF